MDNDPILLTGATSGLGLAAVRSLATGTDRRLIVGARRPEAAAELRALLPPRRLTVLPLDTASLASVRRFAALVEGALGAAGRLGAIACNAGLQFTGPKRLSEDGHELAFATNHLGHHLLVQLLLPRLAPGAAVVGTASGTHDPEDAGARRFGYRGGLFPSAEAVAAGDLDPAASEAQLGRDRYATSKLCVVLFAFGMAARIPAERARFIAFDPGLMPGTGLARDLGAFHRFAWHRLMPLLVPLMPGASTPKRSGAALARLLTEPRPTARGGAHVDFTLRETPSSALSRRRDVQEALLAFGERLFAAGAPMDAREPLL